MPIKKTSVKKQAAPSAAASLADSTEPAIQGDDYDYATITTAGETSGGNSASINVYTSKASAPSVSTRLIDMNKSTENDGPDDERRAHDEDAENVELKLAPSNPGYSEAEGKSVTRYIEPVQLPSTRNWDDNNDPAVTEIEKPTSGEIKMDDGTIKSAMGQSTVRFAVDPVKLDSSKSLKEVEGVDGDEAIEKVIPEESESQGPVSPEELFGLERAGSTKNGMTIFSKSEVDDVSVFVDDDTEAKLDYDSDEDDSRFRPDYFGKPQKGLLDKDASLIPGSPFSKPPNRPSTRPTEPLFIAKYTSTLAFIVTFGWVIFLVIMAAYNFMNVGRIIVEIILALLSFFGLFWNSYFLVSSIMKCFIPSKAFTSNTKYCSIIPEKKPDDAEWLDVTIQIPVYKESLQEVMMPTLISCIAAREHYIQYTEGKARCNIVLCDDGMMSYLKDNFPAAEMLWENVCKTNGQCVRLGKLLKGVPKEARKHLKGMRSKNVYEVFHRMLFYYHYNIGFVARSTVDRRGKFKKASNLNSHLRLALGAAQMLVDKPEEGLSYEDALMKECHNEDGSRYVMFGNDVKLGHLICINDADARMSDSVILKTVPEFLNDPSLGFTQHVTKTMNEQRTESYYTKMLTVYTDALYQGHFLLSSILGCHPPLVGHSIFLRTEALNQVGRMRTLRKAALWLENIGLQFLPVDQIGFGNLQAQNRLEYWSENHVSEDFELMIHLYNLGFNGRYCAYPDCEFQEGITRYFDEEAGRHRKFALGAHELVFNSFPDMLGKGIFTPLFKTFLKCDIPSYYKIFLTAYLCSYASGGAYIIVFTAAAVTRLVDDYQPSGVLAAFSPAGIIILNFAIYYVIGYITFIYSLLRMNAINNKLLFPEYRRESWAWVHIIWMKLRYCLTFQFLFYNVACFTYYFMGSMDHMLARPNVVGATNKDSITISRCRALYDTVKFNSGSWSIAFLTAALAYLTVLQDAGWHFDKLPPYKQRLDNLLFACPAAFISLLVFIVPIILNPWILGWPFYDQRKATAANERPSKSNDGDGDDNSTDTFDEPKNRVKNYFKRFKRSPPPPDFEEAMMQTANKPDVEIGSLASIGYEKSERNIASPSQA